MKDQPTVCVKMMDMDWGKIVIRSIVASIVITIILGILQLGLTLAGLSWFALFPPHALGASFWGLPFGWLKRIITPETGYEIDSLYLVYDIIVWFVIVLIISALRARART